jgi:hypothetical protein
MLQLMPVNLATWEPKMGRIKRFKASSDKQFSRPHLQNSRSKTDWKHGSSKKPCFLQSTKTNVI